MIVHIMTVLVFRMESTNFNCLFVRTIAKT